MSDLNHRPDTLDRAFEALKAVEPPAPPAALADATLSLVRNRLAGTVPVEAARRHQRRRIMRYMGYGSAAGVAAALLVTVGVLWSPGPSPAAEFARVVENAEKARSVTYELTEEQDGKPAASVAYALLGDRVRAEVPGRFVGVMDLAAKKGVELQVRSKTARRFDLAPADLERIGNPVAQLVGLKDKAEPAGQEVVNGRRADVFRATGAAVLGLKGEWTVWVDPKTALPVRIRFRGGDPARALTADKFAWNPDLDPKQFALDVPPGYKPGGAAEDETSGPGRTVFVGFRRALEYQEKAKSFRAVIHTTLPNGPKPPDRKLYAQGEQARMEAGDVTAIGDGKARKVVVLDAKAKTAKVMAVPFQDGGVPAAVDAVKKLLAREGAEELGEKYLDGRKVRGYRAKGLDLNGGKADVTYWIDGKKEVPVRLEIAVTGGPAPMTQVFDYLGFDEDLDPKLFDQTVPAGYKVEEVKPDKE